MLELLEKIRSRKILFLLLLAPLFFTPVKSQEVTTRYDSSSQSAYGYAYARWEYMGIAFGGPFLVFSDNLIFDSDGFTINSIDRFDSNFYPNSKRTTFIDWGRIAYWELWVLLTYFVLIPNIKFKKIAGIWQGF